MNKFNPLFIVFFFMPGALAAQQFDSSLQKMKLSYHYEMKKNFSSAINSISKDDFPREFSYFRLARLGWLNVNEKKIPEAIVFYKKADKTAPNSIESKEALLSLFFSLQQYRNAERMARKIINIYPLHYSARLSLAELALLNLDYAEGEYHLKKIIRMFPADIKANALLLACYNGQKKGKMAEKTEALLKKFTPEQNEKR